MAAILVILYIGYPLVSCSLLHFISVKKKRQSLSVNTDIVDVWENMKEGGSGGVKVNV